jgi:hypothetical protein
MNHCRNRTLIVIISDWEKTPVFSGHLVAEGRFAGFCGGAQPFQSRVASHNG